MHDDESNEGSHLPDEVVEYLAEEEEAKKKELDAFSAIIRRAVDDAIAGKKECGIETQWEEDDAFYNGENVKSEKWLKPQGLTGGLRSTETAASEARCTAFFNITEQFVDSAAARMGDILLPAREWNFAINPTPIPDFEANKNLEATMPGLVDAQGNPIPLGQEIQKRLKASSEAVRKAEKRIQDWLTECRYKAQTRLVFEDAARLGTGILKGPYPEKKTTRVFQDGQLVTKDKIVPCSKRINPRDFFPDPNCGNDIQDGSFVVEREYMTAKQLQKLKGTDYIDSQIDKVLREGVNGKNIDEDGMPSGFITKDSDLFEIWYYFGSISYKDYNLVRQASGEELEEETEEIVADAYDSIPTVIVMVNDSIIKGYLDHLNTEEFIYDVMAWKRVEGQPWGKGVARQGRVAQEMLLASMRALMDNMGLSAIPMVAMLQGAIRPLDNDWTLRAGKQWLIDENSGVRNANEAIQSIIIPTMQAEIMNIVQLAKQMMEEMTGVTALLQGQVGAAPDTVGGMQLMHQNTSALMRRVARIYDENVTERHIARYYDYLLLHGEDDEEKVGDLNIEAVGSSSLVEREIQSMQLIQILQLTENPMFEKSPKKAMDEILRAWKFDPGKFDMSDEEIKALKEQAPPPMPQVEVAKIRSEAELQVAQMRNESAEVRMQIDRDRDNTYAQGVANRDEMTREKVIMELTLKKELAMMKYASDNQTTLEKVKADLATTAMKLNVQKELSNAYGGQAITPAIEPPKRAAPGKSFAE